MRSLLFLLNPGNGDQHIARTVNGYDKDGNAVTVEMYEPQFGNKRGFRFERQHLCPICRFLYYESEMVKVNGTYYCRRFNHHIDAKDS